MYDEAYNITWLTAIQSTISFKMQGKQDMTTKSGTWIPFINKKPKA
jgi:hypothetical protein